MRKWVLFFVLCVAVFCVVGQEAGTDLVQEKIDEYVRIKFADFPRGFASWIQGILFMLFAYHLFAFLENKNKAYLYYSFYVFCFLLYFAFSNRHIFYSGFVDPLKYHMFYSIQVFGYAAYMAFGQRIINTKKNAPTWHRFINYGIYTSLVFGVVFSLWKSLTNTAPLASVFLVYLGIISIVAIGTYGALAAKLKQKHILFFVAGSFIYFVLAYVSLYYSIKGLAGKYMFSFTPLLFMQVGAVIESLMFALLVGYQQRKARLERENVELALAKQAQQATELQLKALRAQMNPHFIFNSLNSINHFIIKEDAENASDYLTKFAKLIRQTLELSNEKTISLAEEISHLELYIKLEQVRLKDGFTYKNHSSTQLNLHTIEIPPLILQPYVENAIWHGLSPKQGDKQLHLNIQETDTHVEVTVEDNGVGRAHANQQPKLRKSYGTQITAQRMKDFGNKQLPNIKIEDLTHNNQPAGTRVSVFLPK